VTSAGTPEAMASSESSDAIGVQPGGDRERLHADAEVAQAREVRREHVVPLPVAVDPGQCEKQRKAVRGDGTHEIELRAGQRRSAVGREQDCVDVPEGVVEEYHLGRIRSGRLQCLGEGDAALPRASHDAHERRAHT
jgi:hypothetical protein